MGLTPQERLAEHDTLQRRQLLAAAERGEDLEKALLRIKEETREPYLRILRDAEDEATVDNDAPVFKLRFPSPDYRPPAA